MIQVATRATRTQLWHTKTWPCNLGETVHGERWNERVFDKQVIPGCNVPQPERKRTQCPLKPLNHISRTDTERLFNTCFSPLPSHPSSEDSKAEKMKDPEVESTWNYLKQEPLNLINTTESSKQRYPVVRSAQAQGQSKRSEPSWHPQTWMKAHLAVFSLLTEFSRQESQD
jgi:hypothetical protein